MKHVLSAKMWSFELHALWVNVPSLVRIVVTGAVLVEKVGVGAVDCVCSQEQNACRDGLPGSLPTVLRPRQHSLASCKRLLTSSELCEGRPCRCGSVTCSVCALCGVCACTLAAGGSGHVGLAHAQASGVRPGGGASRGTVAPVGGSL